MPEIMGGEVPSADCVELDTSAKSADKNFQSVAVKMHAYVVGFHPAPMLVTMLPLDYSRRSRRALQARNFQLPL
jgi:hypothetical protein